MDSAVSSTQLAGLDPDPGRVFGSSVLEWVATSRPGLREAEAGLAPGHRVPGLGLAPPGLGSRC